ncbi:MAG: nitrophenyl compound nitroreductase subunit ArsF family protein [Candidatus Zixiibacteriota bacterium]
MWLSVAIMLSTGVVAVAEQPADDKAVRAVDTATQAQEVSTDSATVVSIIYATYFHGDVRCATCTKLEAYSREAIEVGLEKEVRDSLVVFRTINWDREENAHYIDDYQLYTKALILSRVGGGKEIAWINLDSIWQLVGDKEAYVNFVQRQTRAFLAAPSK